MPWSGSCGRYSCSRNRLSGSQMRGIAREDRLDLREGFHDLDACAAAALIGFEQRRPAEPSASAPSAPTSLKVIERGESMPSVRRSVACALLLNSSAKTSAPLSTRAPEELERPHVGERQRDGPGVAAK